MTSTVTPLPVWINVMTPLGPGHAILIETTPDDQYWTVGLTESGAIVTFPQDRIKMARSYTHGRLIDDEQMESIIRGPS